MLTIENYKKLKGEYIMTHSLTESWKILDVRENKTAYEMIIRHQEPFTFKYQGKELIIKIERERPDMASEYEYVIIVLSGIGVLRRYIIRIENIDTMDSMMHELKTIIESN